jgi:hypothetical protein
MELYIDLDPVLKEADVSFGNRSCQHLKSNLDHKILHWKAFEPVFPYPHSLMEYITIFQARKTLLSFTQEKVTNAGKRVLLLNDESSDEDDYPRAKKPKPDHTKLEDVSMHEYESEEFYDDQGMSDEDDDSDDEPGDSLCIFCDDGGYLLCCDGPCMRSFHPRRKDGIATQCKTLGFPDGTDIEVRLSRDFVLPS